MYRLMTTTLVEHVSVILFPVVVITVVVMDCAVMELVCVQLVLMESPYLQAVNASVLQTIGHVLMK